MSDHNAVIRDQRAEAAIVGAAILAPHSAVKAATDGLDVRHFTHPPYRDAFQAVLDLEDAGEPVSEITIERRLHQEGGYSPLVAREAIGTALASIDTMGSVSSHARHVRELAAREQVRQAGLRLARAAAAGDSDEMDAAEQLLAQPPDADQAMVSGVDRKLAAVDRLHAGQEPRFPLPWPRITALLNGGLAPGAYMLLGGHTSRGKSCAVDQILEFFAVGGLRTALYLTEMTERERTERMIARCASIPYEDVQAARAEDQHRLVLAINRLPEVALIEAHDWTAPEIVRHIRAHRWDAAAVDVMHDIEYRDEADIKEIGRTFAQASKRLRCRLIAAVHLNDNRTTDEPDVPVLRDIRQSGMLARQADIVMFVHRNYDEDGEMVDAGLMRIAKARGARLGTAIAEFRGIYQRWEPFVSAERVVPWNERAEAA